MNSKGKRRDCIYNQQWELNSKYKGWLTAFKADRKKAFCKCCDRMIDILNMGESALKSHMSSKRHKNNSTIGGDQAVTLSSFGFVSCGNGNSGEAGKAGTSQSQQPAVMTIPPPPQDDATQRSQTTLEGHVTKDNVLKAETLWTLKLITSHYSLTPPRTLVNCFQQCSLTVKLLGNLLVESEKQRIVVYLVCLSTSKSCFKTVSVGLLLYCLMKAYTQKCRKSKWMPM